MPRRTTFFILSTIFSFFILFISVHAQTSGKAVYTALAPIQTPNGTEVGTGSNANIGAYFSQMYQVGVGVATALAVLMVIWGGVEYITTDAIGGKEEGKQKVQNAILGLILALGSYLILQTINPALLNTNLNIQTITTAGDREQASALTNALSLQAAEQKAAQQASIYAQQSMTDFVNGMNTSNNTSGLNWDASWSDDLQKAFDDGITAQENGTEVTPSQQAAIDLATAIQSSTDAYNNGTRPTLTWDNNWSDEDQKALKAGDPAAIALEKAVQSSDPSTMTTIGGTPINLPNGVNSDAIQAAMAAFQQYGSQASNQRYMAVMDYSQASNANRFYIVDLQTGEVTANTAAHGTGSDPSNTGMATTFSNVSGSNASVLGSFIATPYVSPSTGKNVLLMNGLEDSNSNTADRGVEIHPSNYVTDTSAGRSSGCIAYPAALQSDINSKLANAFVYNYAPNKTNKQ